MGRSREKKKDKYSSCLYDLQRCIVKHVHTLDQNQSSMAQLIIISLLGWLRFWIITASWHWNDIETHTLKRYLKFHRINTRTGPSWSDGVLGIAIRPKRGLGKWPKGHPFFVPRTMSVLGTSASSSRTWNSSAKYHRRYLRFREDALKGNSKTQLQCFLLIIMLQWIFGSNNRPIPLQ